MALFSHFSPLQLWDWNHKNTHIKDSWSGEVMLTAIQGYVRPHYHSVYTAYLLITYTLSQCTVTCQGDALSLLWWTKSNCSKDQWDWEIIDYYVALPLQQWVSVLFWADCPQKVLNIARLHCHKGMHYSKKFDLVHQTVSPRERMKSGTCKAVLIPSRQSQSSCTKIVHLLGRWSGGLRCGGAPN